MARKGLITKKRSGLHDELCWPIVAPANRRSEAQTLRNAYWYDYLEGRLGVSSAYAVEARIEPEAFGSKDGVSYHQNKWSYYRSGARRPQEKQLLRANKLVRDSLIVFNHSLWSVLELKEDVSAQAEGWLRSLSPEVQCVLFGSQFGSPYERRYVDRRGRYQLELLAGLDSLAALTILLLEAQAKGEHKNAVVVAQSLLRVMLVFCCEPTTSRIGRRLFDLYRRRIFPLAVFNDRCLQLQYFQLHVVVPIMVGCVPCSDARDWFGYKRRELVRQLIALQYGALAETPFDQHFDFGSNFSFGRSLGNLFKPRFGPKEDCLKGHLRLSNPGY
jgi:hypothetical protein